MSKIVSDSLQSRSGNSIIVNNGLNVTGIVSATGVNVSGIVSATGVNVSGIVTATSFVGSGLSLTGIAGRAAAMAIVFGG